MTSKKIVLRFPPRLVDQPIVYKLVKDFDLKFNILKASVTPQEDGLMVLELLGDEQSCEKGMNYLVSSGVKVQPLSEEVVRNTAKCTDCGLCVPLCPVQALSVDEKTKKITFSEDKCIACELCVKICPNRAMEVHF
jgi:ferredoxin